LQASIVRNRLAAQDLAAADQWAGIGMETARRHGHCVTCNALLLPEAVRVAIAHGRDDEADELARRLEKIAEEFGSRAWVAMARHARARVLGSRGEWDAGCAALRAARDAYLASDAIYDAARCRALEAEFLAASGPDLKAKAAELAAQAREVFALLGAPGIEN